MLPEPWVLADLQDLRECKGFLVPQVYLVCLVLREIGDFQEIRVPKVILGLQVDQENQVHLALLDLWVQKEQEERQDQEENLE